MCLYSIKGKFQLNQLLIISGIVEIKKSLKKYVWREKSLKHCNFLSMQFR